MSDSVKTVLVGLGGAYAAVWTARWWCLVPAVAAVAFGLLLDDGVS